MAAKDMLQELMRGSDVMSPAARAQYKKDTGEDVLLGSGETTSASPVTSEVLKHMNETYEATRAIELKKAEAAQALNDKIKDKYARPSAAAAFLRDTGEAISKLYGAHPDTMREALSSKTFVKDLIEVMRDSAKTNSTDKKDTGK